jgi:uroporphyrinogen-III synthase
MAVSAGLAGLRVVSFESRRRDEVASLVRRHGGESVPAPALREVPLTDHTEALAFGEVLLAGACDVTVLLTGVGTRMLVDVLSTRWPRGQVVAALSRTELVCRGPKPVAAVRSLGLQPDVVVPEPNTWRDLLEVLDRERPVSGRRVAVQEYGRRNQELMEGLVERGASVTAVPLYGWTLPDETGPLLSAIDRAVAGELDVAVFTSAHQVENVFEIAERQGRGGALRNAFSKDMVVASIGPITTAALGKQEIEADVTPEHPKMGHLVVTLAYQAESILRRKRANR